jgi:glycine/D-amino acid oxidase-like deaminating enzyme
VRIAVVGGGVAGALLAWRLRTVAVDLYTGPTNDATGASGGLVRGFDASRLAAESLVELLADARLRAAADYREVGSLYLRSVDPAPALGVLDELLPGSASVFSEAEVRARFPFRDLPSGTGAVFERRAGYLSPAALRTAALGWSRAVVRSVPVLGVAPYPALRLADGSTEEYDAVVIATGAWTPALLAASGLDTGGFATKQIQYAVYATRPDGICAFVDDETGLYGRPFGERGFLLGLPCDRWHVDPARLELDAGLVSRTAEVARKMFGWPSVDDRPLRTVVSSDCYHDQSGLALRPVVPRTSVFTFTGGSGGAAKTVLAASRQAANVLLSQPY